MNVSNLLNHYVRIDPCFGGFLSFAQMHAKDLSKLKMILEVKKYAPSNNFRAEVFENSEEKRCKTPTDRKFFIAHRHEIHSAGSSVYLFGKQGDNDKANNRN